MLNTSESKGVCYIETKNLDGETNLKQKGAHPDIVKMFATNQDFSVLIKKKFYLFLIKEKKAWFLYEKPNPFLYKFSG